MLRTEYAQNTSWSQDTLEKLAQKAVEKCSEYGIRILLAILFIVVGFKLSKFLIRTIRKSLEKHGVDPSVTGFLASLSDIVLKILILLTAAHGLGIAVTSFITVLGSAGIAVGLALQGSLSNLAGGVLILILKPYRVGDYIKTSQVGIEGTVISIDIFYTKLKSIDNQTIVVPNGTLSNDSIVNVTGMELRRVDLEVEIAYTADIQKAKETLRQVLEQEKRVIQDREIDIFVGALGESGVMMGIHAWVRTEDYWGVRWTLLEQIKYAFDEAGIDIPYRTMDVNINSVVSK